MTKATESPRERFRRFLRDEESRRASRFKLPCVVSMGYCDYDALKHEVSTKVAELVPIKPTDDLGTLFYADVLRTLNSLGVECMFYDGNIVLRISSSAACGPFIHNLHA